jgi:hypothetical protein
MHENPRWPGNDPDAFGTEATPALLRFVPLGREAMTRRRVAGDDLRDADGASGVFAVNLVEGPKVELEVVTVGRGKVARFVLVSPVPGEGRARPLVDGDDDDEEDEPVRARRGRRDELRSARRRPSFAAPPDKPIQGALAAKPQTKKYSALDRTRQGTVLCVRSTLVRQIHTRVNNILALSARPGEKRHLHLAY